MPDYQKGKIYKITSEQTDDVYIGSCCMKLCLRKAQHKYAYKRFHEQGLGNWVSAFKVVCYDDWKIELLENYACNNDKELRTKEGEYVKNTPHCVNVRIPGRTYKEFYKENKANILAKKKQWRMKNIETVRAKERARYQDNKETIREQARAWYEANKERAAEHRKKWRDNNKDKIKQYHKNNYANMTEEEKEQTRARQRQYYQANKEKYKQYYRAHKEDEKILCEACGTRHKQANMHNHQNTKKHIGNFIWM